MHRQPEHVIQYMFAEMGTTGSVDGSGRLVIRGRFQPKQIEHVLRRYICTPNSIIGDAYCSRSLIRTQWNMSLARLVNLRIRCSRRKTVSSSWRASRVAQDDPSTPSKPVSRRRSEREAKTRQVDQVDREPRTVRSALHVFLPFCVVCMLTSQSQPVSPGLQLRRTAGTFHCIATLLNRNCILGSVTVLITTAYRY